MSGSSSDAIFDGSIPELYDTYFVPIIFEPYAADLVSRLPRENLSNVLEVAAGTGVVTRALASSLPRAVTIVATDLNEAMLAQAKSVGTETPVEWRQAERAGGRCQDWYWRRRAVAWPRSPAKW